MKKRFVFLSVIIGCLGCMGAVVCDRVFYRYTLTTSEIVYNEPFTLDFQMWLTKNQTTKVMRYVFSTSYLQNGKLVQEHITEKGGAWQTLHTMSSVGDRYELRLTHVPMAPPGVPYHISFLVNLDGPGDITIGYDIPGGVGRPYSTKSNPFRLLPMKEYHPHRPTLDFHAKNAIREYYYLFRPVNRGESQMLAPFNLRFEKRREGSGTEQFLDATEAVLVVKKAADVFALVSNYVDMISGDVRFDLMPVFDMGGMTFRLKDTLYVDKGTGVMSARLEDRVRQVKTNHLVMPFDDRHGITQFDCELQFKAENEYWKVVSSQINPFRGLCDQNQHYYIDMETRI